MLFTSLQNRMRKLEFTAKLCIKIYVRAQIDRPYTAFAASLQRGRRHLDRFTTLFFGQALLIYLRVVPAEGDAYI